MTSEFAADLWNELTDITESLGYDLNSDERELSGEELREIFVDALKASQP